MKITHALQLNGSSKILTIDHAIDKLLLIISLIAFFFLSPYFIWSNEVVIYRILHFLGNVIFLYIIFIKNEIYLKNIPLVLFYFLISLYIMIGGTENSHISYIHLITLLFIFLKPTYQIRIFDHFITIISIVYLIGLISYTLSLFNLNINLGTAIAPNITKNPYLIYFGHVEESDLLVYRFSSVFDEPGIVGTLSGLILASIGISIRNIRSIIILLAGLVSLSLAFYIILILIGLFNLKIKTLLIILCLTTATWFASGDLFDNLIINRLAIENGRLAGDNRTDSNFDEYYNIFHEKGGNNFIFGKGYGSFRKEAEEDMFPSSYKLIIIDYGIFGLGLIFCFYILSNYLLNNSKKGWFLCFIFFISAYQRPDLINFHIIILFLGGLMYIKFINNLIHNKLITNL